MNDSDWIQSELDRYTYRPGWQFEVAQWSDGALVLHVTYEVPNSQNVDEKLTLHSAKSIPSSVIGNENELAKFIQQFLFRIEVHESKEWFRRDGVILDDPHTLKI